ncbi:chemotaxis protein CheA [Roseburia sp. 499]|uniref:chemotaxis protein CheA n=1 Tax=Roseburia sp. 499 TaxID=1261634 RepID=UPI000952F0E1|nr:chemotaxis protein CheA [Roseburia sp. 499]WVK71236.1 chemotaxis protein CheA [Roseburia sp. 499]
MDVSQYLEIFIDETNEHLQNLSDCIMSLEKDPENMDTINEIFRAAHSLKGMAGTMGFKRMQHLTHDMENVFQEVRSGNMKVTSGLVDVLFQCLDAIDAYLENVKESSDEGTEDNEAIIQELNDILAAETGNVSEEKTAAAPQQEEKKEEAKNDEYEKRYFSVELSEKEKDSIKSAEERGMNVYGITVYIQEECLLKAARAFLVFKAVEDYGNILVYYPSSQDIEDEKFENDFSFFLETEAPLEKIMEVSKAVSEIAEVVGEKVNYKDLVAVAEKKETAEVETEKTAPVAVAAPAEKTAPAKTQTKAATTKKQAAGKPVTNRTVRVDIEKLDALMNQVSELIIAKNSLVSISSTEGSSLQSQTFHEQIEYLERITTNLHESVMKVRMVPIESVVNKFPRMIRDLSKKLNKEMELIMTGEDTELDRTVVDQIGDPLQHLLRNSADHGLESGETRRKRGKPEKGTICLNAFQEGNNVIIEVSDDGNGIDTERVKEKAIERGLVTPEQAEALSQKEIIDFLFMPSFSMAKQITDISGRGVGLDVVKSNIEALGGDVEVKSVMGEGTKFIVRLPLTLAIIQALMVEVHDEKYAIALGSIQTIEDIPVSEIKYVQAKEVIHIRGSVIPLIRLEKVLDMEPTEEEKESLTVVIVKKGEKFAGLVVDNLMGQQEIVIKSIGKYINNTKIISGATILGDGEVALILDANVLL